MGRLMSAVPAPPPTPRLASAALAPEPAEDLKIKWGRQVVMWWAKSASTNLQQSGGANAPLAP